MDALHDKAERIALENRVIALDELEFEVRAEIEEIKGVMFTGSRQGCAARRLADQGQGRGTGPLPGRAAAHGRKAGGAGQLKDDNMKSIATALVSARKAFGPALKTKTNPHLKAKYADLAACLEAVEDALTASGVWLYQETSECADGVTVETVFLHESGESLRCGKLHVPAVKSDPQGYGSALTYARRYSLMAACGIAAEDDDGNAARKTHKIDADLMTRAVLASNAGMAKLTPRFGVVLARKTAPPSAPRLTPISRPRPPPIVRFKNERRSALEHRPSR
jgi:hypothetical protein